MSRTKELPSSNVGKYIQLFGLLLAFGMLAFFYMKREGIWLYASVQPPGDTAGGRNAGKIHGVQEEKNALPSGYTPPEIVAIATPWGRGAGFFLWQGFIITGRHLVEPDLKKIAALEEQVARNKELLQSEEAKLNSYQERPRSMKKGAAKKELSNLIVEREEYVAAFRAQQHKDEQRLAWQKKAQQQSDIRVVLANGSEHPASQVKISKKYDLALLTVSLAQKTPVLQPPPLDSLLNLGDTVFIPTGFIGIGAKMTPGTFTGYRRIGVHNRMYLQIDVKIAQNISGAPLLDTAGFVRAVATKTVQGSKDVFAIPIEQVIDEFAEIVQ